MGISPKSDLILLLACNYVLNTEIILLYLYKLYHILEEAEVVQSFMVYLSGAGKS